MKSNLPSGLNYRTFPLTLSASAFHNLILQGVVVDGRAGGLILGRSYEEGGITVITQRGADFFIHSCVEGGEFILNKDASCRNLARLRDMNVGRTAAEVVNDANDLTEVSQFVITNGAPDDRMLWISWNQVVVAKTPSLKHLSELIRLNQTENPFMRCDLNELFPAADGTTDGVV
ncbi:MAG TPA: hypothetical protein VHD62_06290 [Opitutaceae bacterium]|nr:hypothetical protein [Opitutaceae bacterium]